MEMGKGTRENPETKATVRREKRGEWHPEIAAPEMEICVLFWREKIKQQR